MTEKDRNLRVAEALCKDLEWNGRTFREGECVALLEGLVVAIADNPDAAISALRSIAPDPRRGMVIEVAHPLADVIR